MFISQFSPGRENHMDIKPVTLGYSSLTECLISIWKELGKLTKTPVSEKKEFDLRIKAGFPPKQRLFEIMENFKPDLCIVRERSLYNIAPAAWCRKNAIPCILYNQSPLYDKPGRDRGILKSLLIKMLPPKRMTPVLGKNQEDNVRQPNSYFVPFIGEKREKKKGYNLSCPNILCIARYEERKRLFLLIKALEKISTDNLFTITIAGECADPDQEAYYNSLVEAVKTAGLWKRASLLKNLPMEDVYRLYEEADIFVLPSTRERASVAQIEAMSFSLPVICSDSNGSACYVEPGVNGFLFKDDDVDDLSEKLSLFFADKACPIEKMGWESYRLINEKYLFKNYYEGIMNIIKPG